MVVVIGRCVSGVLIGGGGVIAGLRRVWIRPRLRPPICSW